MITALELKMTANTAQPTWTSNKGWSDGWTMPANLAALETDDYQKRDGQYPKSNVPDSIRAYRGKGDETTLEFQFKNTSEATGKAWAKNFCETRGLKVVRIGSNQSGDYHDDWIDVRAHIAAEAKAPKAKVEAVLPPVVKASKEAGENEQRKVAKKLAIGSINDLLRAAGLSITFKSGSTTTNRMLAYNKKAYLSSMMPDAVEQYLREAGVTSLTLVQVADVLKKLK
jgi:hypothetical protein